MSVIDRMPIPASNFAAGRNGQQIDRVVLHTMVSWISSADARFHDPASQVSAHFGVRIDGTLWQWVNTWDTAFHAGDLSVNYRSIGIEHEDGGAPNDPRPDVLYARSSALVAQFCTENAIPCARGTGGPGIYDHRQIVATACPDALDTDRIIWQAQALITAGKVNALLAGIP